MVLTGLLLVPIVGSLTLLLVRSRLLAKYLNIFCSGLTFFFSLWLSWQFSQSGSATQGNDWFYIDALNVPIIVLTAFIGFTTAIYNFTYLYNEKCQNKLSIKSLRFFPSLYQFFLFIVLLILTTNNLGILWVAMEGATLCTVLLVGLYHLPESLEAAWKYLILCGVGLAQALLGVILLYFAAEKVMDIHSSLFWTQLNAASSQLSPRITEIAFVFILVGYGTKLGFVPLHNWLPDVYGESIAPVLALLSGILLNATFYAILRCKMIVDGAAGPEFTNHFLIGFGLLNVLVAAFFLLRQREIRRLFAYSSIEHVGLISFAFGLGTPLAVFAGMFHMLAHSLSKTAVFFSAGQAIQVRGTAVIGDIRGLVHDHPVLGWGLLLSSLSLLGVPPFALFTSEFLILLVAIKQYPLLVLLLVAGMGISFAAIFHKVQAMVFADKPALTSEKITLSFFPIYVHLFIILLLGLSVPFFLLDLSSQISHMLSGT